jgi:hypothetical protein
MKTNSVDLFTKEEHAILAEWFKTEPKCDAPDIPCLRDALETLGFVGKASLYSEEDAAVAAIVLERIQNTLPQWASVRLRESDDDETDIFLAREVRERRAKRTVELLPKYLLTINWADSGPGFSWPVAYHVTWVPIYNQYVVTQSADSPDAYGYCDFAIGHFPATDDFVSKATNEIRDDWTLQRDQCCQASWEYLFDEGLINDETAQRLRREVWGDEYNNQACVRKTDALNDQVLLKAFKKELDDGSELSPELARWWWNRY